MEPSAPPPPDDNIFLSALEDFEADERKATDQKPPAAAGANAAQGAASGAAPADFAMNMSALLKELANVEQGASKPTDDVQHLIESGNVAIPADAVLQSSISQTLASLAESAKKLEEQAKTGGGAGGDSDALLEKLLMEQMGSNTEFQGMMENMLNQLMAKEIMYAPLAEMKEKYPGWISKNSATLSVADLARYQKQAGLLGQICELYEKEPLDMPRIIALMQEMQDCGQPPQEIVKELAPDAANDLAAATGGAGVGGAADPNCIVM